MDEIFIIRMPVALVSSWCLAIKDNNEWTESVIPVTLVVENGNDLFDHQSWAQQMPGNKENDRILKF